MKYSEKQITRLLDGIFDGTITELDLPLDYYTAVVDYLKQGLYKGFGMDFGQALNTGGKDLELLTELRENIYMFSAGKTYHFVEDVNKLLVDEDGNIRTQVEFNKLGRQAYDTWNNDWGKTEYNTAIGQGTMASKWNEIEKNKSFLPLLKYSAIGDACVICAPLDGMIEPVDSPIWDTVMPLNHFGCFCTVLQLDDIDNAPTTGNADILKEVEGKMQDVFKNNVGKTGEVFSKDHPYFTGPGKNNFGLPIPDKDE